ncbi:MAG: membrane protein insertion efficiency factor YidD [Verrucomicrobia bacterium]|nr:membrane protein insertion efficiency factor YidD [Verrucomicrobiota bacterium]MBS0637535.1 membrane protein insertion efficiency factor YidD [Verrucomicrobiota bacterium]
MKYLAIFLIKCYRLCISPLVGSCCRFEVTCSEYALKAFHELPFFQALWLTIKRIVKCNPWH